MPKPVIAMVRNRRSPCALLSDRDQAKHTVGGLARAMTIAEYGDAARSLGEWALLRLAAVAACRSHGRVITKPDLRSHDADRADPASRGVEEMAGRWIRAQLIDASTDLAYTVRCSSAEAA